jgi:hypothetical protein
MYNQEELQKLQKAKEKLEPELLNLVNVRGISIGTKIKNNKSTGYPALVVHVYKKLPLTELHSEANVTSIMQNFDRDLMTDVVENEEGILQYLKVPSEHKESQIDYNKYRPLLGGCLISVSGDAGTGGCIAHSKSRTNEEFIITCKHVVESSSDKKVYQPTYEEDNMIGKVESQVDNIKVDCASVKLSGDIESKAEIIEIGSVKGTADPELDAKVKKRGARTGLTYGKISNISYTGYYAGKQVENQIIISKINDSDPRLSDGGDSGSAWVLDENNKVVGLHWAGGLSGSQACACLISDVENELSVVISTE